MAEGPHLDDLTGAFVACRKVLVAELRSLGDEFAMSIFAQSRNLVDEIEAVGFLDGVKKQFAVIVVAEQPEIVFDPDEDRRRFYRPSYILWIVQKAKDGKTEDEYMDRFEAIRLRLAGRGPFAVEVEEGTFLFEIASLTSIIPMEIVKTKAGVAIGYAAVDRVVLETEACAS